MIYRVDLVAVRHDRMKILGVPKMSLTLQGLCRCRSI